MKPFAQEKGGSLVCRLAYDGDGVRRKRLDTTGTIHYVGPYERNLGNGWDTSEVVTKFYSAALGGMSRLIGFRKAGTLYYVGTDHLGSTIRVANENFTDPVQMRYKPFGGDRDTGTNLETDHKYTSQVEDASIGLYWYGFRAYDPAIGRFVAPDTIVPNPGNPQNLNRYSYALNNPLRYSDPTGHDIFEEDPWDEGWQNQEPAPEYSEPSADVWAEYAGYGGAVDEGSSIFDQIAQAVAGAGAAAATAMDLASSAIGEAFGATADTIIGAGLAATGIDTAQVGNVGNVTVVNNATGLIGSIINAIGGGKPNTITLSSTLIVSSYDVQNRPETMRHEFGHIAQAERLGVAYLPTYVMEYALTVAVFGTTNVHDFLPMERQANIMGGIRNAPWNPSWQMSLRNK